MVIIAVVVLGGSAGVFYVCITDFEKTENAPVPVPILRRPMAPAAAKPAVKKD